MKETAGYVVYVAGTSIVAWTFDFYTVQILIGSILGSLFISKLTKAKVKETTTILMTGLVFASFLTPPTAQAIGQYNYTWVQGIGFVYGLLSYYSFKAIRKQNLNELLERIATLVGKFKGK